MWKLVVVVALVAGCRQPDPLTAEERGLRQSEVDGEGMGNDRCNGEGCPVPDTDRDGIDDATDACPDEPDTDPVGTAFDGCPTASEE